MAYSPLNSSIISVTNFGARGDGITDNKNAIQAAIDSLQSKGLPGTVYLPKGKYISSGQLLISGHNITLQGEPGATIQAINENDFRKILVTGFTGILTSGVTIQGLTIDGGRTGGNTAEVYDGVINLINTKNTSINNNSINNFLGIGVYTTYNNENIDIVNNYVSNYHIGVFNNGALAGCGLKYMTVDNNEFDQSWGSAAGSNYYSAIKIQGPHNFPCYGHKITNNKVLNPSLLGIELWGMVNDSIVCNNYIESGVFGISIAAESKNIVVGNNTTRNCTLYGIELAESEKITVVGNVVDGGTGKSTRDGIIINSTENSVIQGNVVSNCNHSNITTYISSFPVKNLSIIGNNLIQTGIGGIPFYYQGGHNVNFSENTLDCKGSGNYFIMIDTANFTTQQTGLTIARNDIIGSVTDWGILFYAPSSSGIQNVLIEQNKTYGVEYCGYGMLNKHDNPPISALGRDNYGRTGSLGYYIDDFQVPQGSSPYGTTNLANGIQYYGTYSYTIPPTVGITGDGVWLCVWSGGLGNDFPLRLRYQGYSDYNNNATTTEFYSMMIPYASNDIYHTLMAMPQGNYFGSQILQAKTLTNESTTSNSLWIKLASVATGSYTPLSISYSEANSLTSPVATYTEPIDTTNNAKLFFNQSNNENLMLKVSRGVAYGNDNQIYSPNSGVLTIASTGLGFATIPTSTTANSGFASLPPAPIGFAILNITGSYFKIPYYNL